MRGTPVTVYCFIGSFLGGAIGALFAYYLGVRHGIRFAMKAGLSEAMRVRGIREKTGLDPRGDWPPLTMELPKAPKPPAPPPKTGAPRETAD